MSATTTERPAAHQPNPVRSTESADLIRTVCGVHAPAAWPWLIGSGQQVGLAARGRRTRTLHARVCTGALIITDDLLGSALDFTLLLPDSEFCIAFSTRVTRFLSADSWQADGTMTTATGSRAVSLRLRYNGVFRERGRQPCLWLTIHATVDLRGLGLAVGRRRTHPITIDAELNLNPRSDADGLGAQSS